MNTNKPENDKLIVSTFSDVLENTIRKQQDKPIDDHPCKKFLNRPYNPGTLWVEGIDKDGFTVWV